MQSVLPQLKISRFYHTNIPHSSHVI